MGIVEEWRSIPEYEGIYEASTLGRIKSIPRHGTKGGILRRDINSSDGYASVDLYKDGIRSRQKVHRLILFAFIDVKNDLQCNHKNGDKLDNRFCNLEYMTHQENVDHARNILGVIPVGEDCRKAVLNNKQVHQIRHMLKLNKIKQVDIAKMFNVSPCAISDIKHRNTWKHI